MSRLRGHLYPVAAIALVSTAVLGIAIPYVLGYPNLSVLGLYVAIPLIAVPIVAHRARFDGQRRSPVRVDWRVWSILFHLVLAALVGLLLVTGTRPYEFFGGVAVLYALCFLLIATTASGRRRRAIVLYHLSVLVLLVVYSVTLNYDFFVGHTDLTAHVSMTTTIVETGRTSTMLPGYEAFQPWHVYAAVSSLAAGGWLATHDTMYVLSGVIFAAGLWLLYGFARRLYPNERFGLLSCLLAASFPLYVFYGMYSIPRSVASILFLALLLTLASRPQRNVRILTTVFVAAIVVYHPVTIPFVFAILVLVAFAERLVRTPDRLVDAYTLSITFLFTAIYWLYTAEFVVAQVESAIVTAFFEPTESAIPEGVVASPWVELANYVPFGFALFFLFLGFLLVLRRVGRDDAGADTGLETAAATRADGAGGGRGPARHLYSIAAVTVVAVALVPLIFPGPALLLDALAGVNVDRFGHYGYMFVALTGGYGLYELVNRGGLTVLVVLLLLVSLFGFTAVSNDVTASDNPLVERPFYTFYVSDQERQSFAAIDDGFQDELAADRPTCRYVGELHGAPCTVVTAEDGDEMFDGHDGVVIREAELADRPLQFTAYVDESDLPRSELEDRDRVYDSGAIALYS